jgi:hypothetical protein
MVLLDAHLLPPRRRMALMLFIGATRGGSSGNAASLESRLCYTISMLTLVL